MFCQHAVISRLARLIVHAVRFVVLGVVVWGCSSDNRIPIVVYSPHGKEMLVEFEKLYEKSHPGHDVRWMDMGSQDVLDRLRTERTNPQADVWWGAPMTTFDRAAQEGLLAQYHPSWKEKVRAEFRHNGGYWYGTFITPEVILYNTRLVAESEVPRDWDDLLDPAWKGKIIVRYPVASGTMRIIFGAMILREVARGGTVSDGFAWLQRLDANTKTYAANPTQLYLKIAREEGSISLWNLPDAVIQRELNGYPFGYVIPRSGTPLITDGIAIVNGARHPSAARQFYEFVTSAESLILQAEKFYRIPARLDIEKDRLPAWMRDIQISPLPIDWDTLAANEQRWMQEWDDRVKGTGSALTVDR
ncbi:MAG: extracellular solute-binding protein [Bacteroidota bacterium]